ncbi:MAG: molybdopterin-dependent oxidoreductase, partial [Pseudomonadota bacterium]
ATGLPIGVIGEQADLRYEYQYLGAGPDTLKDLVSGENKFAAALKKAKRPLIIVGQGALSRGDGAAVLGQAAKLADAVGAVQGDWNGFSVLHTAAGRVGGLDTGFVPTNPSINAENIAEGSDVLFLLGADELDMSAIPASTFVVYIGTHGDAGAQRADVILPAATYTEKSATYVNTEGRVQMTARAAFPPGEAREDWSIFRALSAVVGKPLPYDSLQQLRAAMYQTHPHLMRIDEIQAPDDGFLAPIAKLGGRLTKKAFVSPVEDFYLTNPICRASATLAECSKLALGQANVAAE